jgi:SAM-dependent methyltransferase
MPEFPLCKSTTSLKGNEVERVADRDTGAADLETIRLLRGAFDYFIGHDQGAVVPGYFWFRKRQRVLRLIERHLSNLGQSLILPWKAVELGCGDGTDFYLIRRKISELGSNSPRHFIGVDGNFESLRMCRLKKIYYGAFDSDFVRCDLSQEVLPFNDDEFDFVYCSEVLEHLRKPETLLKEVKRILKPKGYFLITTPNEPNLFQRSYIGAKEGGKKIETGN